MKDFFKWTAGILLTLGAIYGIAIFVVPPTTFETRFQVARSAEEVWEVFMDETQATKWLKGLTSIERTSGEAGAVGSRYRIVFEEAGHRTEMEEVVTVVNEPREFAFDIESSLFSSQVTLRLEGRGQLTKIITKNKIRGRGWFAPVLLFTKDAMIQRQEEDYQRLKALIEAP